MTFEARRLELIRYLTTVKDEAKLVQIETVAYDDVASSNWRLSAEQRAFLEESIADGRAGNTVPHEEVMREVKAKIGETY